MFTRVASRQFLVIVPTRASTDNVYLKSAAKQRPLRGDARQFSNPDFGVQFGDCNLDVSANPFIKQFGALGDD
eukprot:1012871-Heterocapsa_arctica.AAC.1